MAQRRMFSLDIVSSDAFLDMPLSSQALYFHLGINGDDDGFVNPRKIMRMIGVSEDDLKILIAKRFVIAFKTGVIVIKHWLNHNLIRADLYHETNYKNEKAELGLNENGAYTELNNAISEIKKLEEPEWLKRRRGETVQKRTANGTQSVHRLGKDRLGKDNILDEQKARPLSANGNTHLKEPTEKQLVYRRVIGHLQATLSMAITSWGKQCQAIKSMLDAGYTELQITKTIDYMANKDEFYADKGFDMTTVAKQIPLYKARMRKELPT